MGLFGCQLIIKLLPASKQLQWSKLHLLCFLRESGLFASETQMLLVWLISWLVLHHNLHSVT